MSSRKNLSTLKMDTSGQLYFDFPDVSLVAEGTFQKCSRCGITKPLSRYYKAPGHRLGYKRICADCKKAWMKKRDSNPRGWARRISRRIKYRSKEKGWNCGVTEGLLLERLEKCDYRCEVTGVGFDFITGVGRKPNTPSVDRIDNTKPYTADNIQLVCWAYNDLKREVPESVLNTDEAIAWVRDRVIDFVDPADSS